MLVNLLALSAASAGLAAAAIPSYAGYNVVWSDDFTGAAGSQPNSANWKFTTPANTNNDVQQWTTSTNNARLSGDGSLYIIPQKDSAGHWTSARLESVPTFQSKVGYKMRIEAQIRLGTNAASKQQGIWPAFWAMGASARANPPTAWPACAEWDIMETINGNARQYGTLHCDKYPGGICNEPVGRSTNVAFTPGSLHTFSMEIDRKTYTAYNDWPKQTLSWYLDGNLFQQIKGSDIGDLNVWTQVTRNPLYLIADVAVGGNFPGAPNSATAGGIDSGMIFNYVAVYMTT